MGWLGWKRKDSLPARCECPRLSSRQLGVPAHASRAQGGSRSAPWGQSPEKVELEDSRLCGGLGSGLRRARMLKFSSKKPKRSFRQLQAELENREKITEINTVQQRRENARLARVAIHEQVDQNKTHAYLDLRIGASSSTQQQSKVQQQKPTGRIIVELFDDLMPKTVDKFIQLLAAEDQPTYKNSLVSHVFPGDYCIVGSHDHFVDEGGIRKYDHVYAHLADEVSWNIPHLNPGILSLVDEKTPRFHITLRKMEEFDGLHAVFGKVVYGFDVLKVLSESGTPTGRTKEAIVILGGGRIPSGSHPREFLKKLEVTGGDGLNHKRVMRMSTTYRHTDLIGQ